MTIVFDLGAVLIDWNPRFLYRQVFADEQVMEDFLTNVCHGDWNEQQDAGRPWSEAIAERSAKFPEYTEEIGLFWSRWTDMLNGPIEGTVEILKELKEGGQFRLLALTNWSAETWPYATERYDFLNWFDGILVSGQEKMKKPSRAIYDRFCERFDEEADNLLFIDDSARNIAGARAAGWTAIQYTSPEALRAELKQLGVLN